MREPRNAKLVTLFALVGSLTLAFVLVMLLKMSAHRKVLPAITLFIPMNLCGMLVVGLFGFRAWMSAYSKVRPLRGFGAAYVVSPLSGAFVVMRRFMDGRPVSMSWHGLASSLESISAFSLTGLGVCLAGMLLVAFDLARMMRHRAANDAETWQAKEGLPRLSSLFLLTGLSPELGVFESVEIAMDVQKRALAHIHLGRVVLGGLFGLLVVNALVFHLRLPVDGWILDFAQFLLVAVGFSWPWLRENAFRRYVREEAWRAGFPLCVECGYDLRGLASERCPECGGVMDRSLGEGAAR